MAIGDELLALEFAPSDRNSLLRGIIQVRLLRGAPVDDLFAEYAEVLVSKSRPPGGVELRRRRWPSGISSPCDFAGAAALLGEGRSDGDAQRSRRPATRGPRGDLGG